MPSIRFPVPARLLSVLGLMLVAGVVQADGPVVSWLRGSNGYPVDFYAPGNYGYNLWDRNPGYYGGGNYREYYAYGRGVFLANFPDSPPGPQWLWDNRNWIGTARVHPWTPWFPLPGGPTTLPRSAECCRVTLYVPEGAVVWLEGKATEQTGTTRVFVTPTLKPGERYAYEVRARWEQNGKPVEQKQTVYVEAGTQIEARFPAPEPTRLPQGLSAAPP
jgi:uncharacterized protein (TIGR03000 family)